MKRRALGQHFLASKKVARILIESVRDKISASDVILEIGAGRGLLTRIMCKELKHKIVAVEIDIRLCEKLREIIFREDNKCSLTLICGDAFRVIRRFDVLISTPPYSQSSRLLLWLMKHQFKMAALVLQKEFVDKLLASKKEKNYKPITVLARILFKVRILGRISADAFRPKPSVSSSAIVITRRALLSDRELEWLLKKINLVFSNRKRKIRNLVNAKLVPLLLEENRRVIELEPQEVIRVAAVLPT